MLPIQFRLKNRKEFNNIFRQGKAVSNDVLMIKYSQTKPSQLEIGFSVGLKFSKKSSKRNKVKRWMREAARSIIGRIKTGHKIIFLANSKFPYKQMSHSLIREKTENLLRKAKLFRQ